MSIKSILENIVQGVVKKSEAEGREPKVTRLTSDWKLAEKYFSEYLKDLILLGLNDSQNGSGNLLLFANLQELQKEIAQIEVGGKWIWVASSISSLNISDNHPFPPQEHSALISETDLHIGQRVIAFKLWQPVPHLALAFSDGSVLAIHGDNGQYESWGFDTLYPPSIGVYALPGGPIAVG